MGGEFGRLHFFLLYLMGDLDCTVGSQAEPSSHEYILHIACVNRFIEFFVKHQTAFIPTSSVCALFVQEDVMLVVN